MTHHPSNWRKNPVVRLIVLVVVWIWRWNNDHEGQRPFLGRFTAHAAVILTIVLLIVVGNPKLDAISTVTDIADNAVLMGLVQNVDAASSVLSVEERPYYRMASQARIVRQAQYHTAIPERPRLDIVTYTVVAGDTAQYIADQFGLQPTTIMWSIPIWRNVLIYSR